MATAAAVNTQDRSLSLSDTSDSSRLFFQERFHLYYYSSISYITDRKYIISKSAIIIIMKNHVVTTAVLLLPILSLVSGKDCFNQLSTFTPIKDLQYVLDSDQLLEVSVRVHRLVHLNPHWVRSLPTPSYIQRTHWY